MKFTELELHPLLLAELEKIGFEECTPIQEEAIPTVLAGRDVAGLAQTGTGKTGAFLIPMIDRILRSREAAPSAAENMSPNVDVEISPEEPETTESTGDAQAEKSEEKVSAETAEESTSPEAEQKEEKPAKPENKALAKRIFPNWKPRNFVLILVPTRELADQVYQNAIQLIGKDSDLSAVSVYGGTSYDKQKAGIRKGAQFVIATPGRLIDLYKEHIIDLRQARAIIFDEADRMFDMGFKDDMRYILRRVPEGRQLLMFSATMNFDVLNVAYEFGSDPVEVNIDRDQAKAENVEDELFHVGQGEKAQHLLSLLKRDEPHQAIIFSNFKRNVERIAKFLSRNGIPAVGISSLLTQAQRNRVMEQFKGKSNRNILVATDVAARGLDILGVDLVINYELPDDPENYVHRIGRTGRAGAKGKAYSLVSDRDVAALTRLHDYLGHKIAVGWLEDEHLVSDFQPFPSDQDQRRAPQKSKSGGQKGRRPSGGRGKKRPDDSRKKSAEGRGEERKGPPKKHRRKKPAGGAEAQKDGGRSSHRDRALGRHKSLANGEASSPRPNGEARPQKKRNQKSSSQRRRNQRTRGKRPNPPTKQTTQQQKQTIGTKVSGFFKKLFGSQ